MERKRLNIGIYGDPLLAKRTGIGNYAYYLSKALVHILPDAHFFLFCQKEGEVVFPRNFTVVAESRRAFTFLPKAVWFRFFSGRLINCYHLDALWCVLPVVPRGVKVRKVVTVHDLNHLLVPHTMKLRARFGYKIFFNQALSEADRIICVSSGTKRRLKEYFGVEVDAVVYPGVDRRIYSPRKGRDLEKYLQLKGITFKYILTVSTLEPRKNLESLVSAFLELKRSGRFKDYKLVLVGDSGWKNSSLRKKIRKYRSDVFYLGYVPEEELPFLYSGAALFVLPSIYEGFGMPAQEARACGCCVMVSDVPELHESAGAGAIYVKPTKEGLKEALSLFEEGKLRCSREKLLEGLFSWEEEAKKLAEVLVK